MRKRGIAIELTSLLDVILIMMFLLLMQNADNLTRAVEIASDAQAASEILSAKVNELEHERESLLDENDRMRRRATGSSIAEENSSIILLSVEESEQGRAILVETLGSTLSEISLDWQNRNYAENALNAVLTECVEQTTKQAVFIIFEYDRNNIYQSDYSLITRVIQRHKQDSNVYTAEYDINLRGG